LGCDIRNADDATPHDFSAAEWYLTVRCTHPACGGLIAFQKSAYCEDNPNLRVKITGRPSVNCPHCMALVHFGSDQIERKRVFVTESIGAGSDQAAPRRTLDS
jgi:hypothetical protein